MCERINVVLIIEKIFKKKWRGKVIAFWVDFPTRFGLNVGHVVIMSVLLIHFLLDIGAWDDKFDAKTYIMFHK